MSSSSASPPPLGLSEKARAEKRETERHNTRLTWTLRCVDADEDYECVCENIGVGGLCLRAGAELPPGTLKVGTRLELSGPLPNLQGRCEAKAIVRWVDRGDERLVGVAFETGLRAREVLAINQMRDAA